MRLMNKRHEHLGRIYKLQVRSVQGMRKRYREEDMKLFVHWCNKNGFHDKGVILQVIDIKR